MDGHLQVFQHHRLGMLTFGQLFVWIILVFSEAFQYQLLVSDTWWKTCFYRDNKKLFLTLANELNQRELCFSFVDNWKIMNFTLFKDSEQVNCRARAPQIEQSLSECFHWNVDNFVVSTLNTSSIPYERAHIYDGLFIFKSYYHWNFSGIKENLHNLILESWYNNLILGNFNDIL